MVFTLEAGEVAEKDTFSVFAGIAMNEPINSHQNSCPAGDISQTIDPVHVFIRLLNTHAKTVAFGLRMSRRAGCEA